MPLVDFIFRIHYLLLIAVVTCWLIPLVKSKNIRLCSFPRLILLIPQNFLALQHIARRWYCYWIDHLNFWPFNLRGRFLWYLNSLQNLRFVKLGSPLELAILGCSLLLLCWLLLRDTFPFKHLLLPKQVSFGFLLVLRLGILVLRLDAS